MDEKLKNVMWLAISVGVMFTGYFTMAGTSETIIRAYNERTGDNVSSFVSFGILSISNAIGCFFVAPVAAMIGRKNTYFIGGILQTAYIVTYINPQPTVLYLMSVIGGLGAAFIWVPTGITLGVNSTESTGHRNTCFFWIGLQSGNLFGNLYVFFAWGGADGITKSMQISTIAIAGSISLVGTFLTLFIKEIDSEDDNMKPSEKIKTALRTAKDWRAQLIIAAAIFGGIEQGFVTNIYPTCVGASKSLGSDTPHFIGISSILVGVGEIVGAAFQLSDWVQGLRAYLYLIAGGLFFVVNALMFIFLPNDCTNSSIYESPLVDPTIGLILVCSFLFGMTDAIFSMLPEAAIGLIFYQNELILVLKRLCSRAGQKQLAE